MATRIRAPRPLTSLPSGAGAALTIDVSSLEEIARNMVAAKIQMNFALQSKLTRAANVYASELSQAAPSSDRPDPRQPVKLNQSFRVLKVGSERQVITTAPQKLAWTNEGTKPPSMGTGHIFPRAKKALYWPGLSWGNAVAYVAKHKGVYGAHPEGKHWADRVINKYLPGSSALPNSADNIASTTADWWVETFTNLNKQGRPATLRKFIDVMGSVGNADPYGIT